MAKRSAGMKMKVAMKRYNAELKKQKRPARA